MENKPKSLVDLYTGYSLRAICESTNKIHHRIYSARLQEDAHHESPIQSTIGYAVLNYDKELVCFDESINITQLRSVILSHPENELLSFSPPRSIPKSQFYESYPDVQSDDLQITEIVEGSLIHLFYDKRIQSWQIATKSAVGGQYTFFDKSTKDKHKTTTVFEMFLDALGISRNTTPLYLNHFLNSFPKYYSYSFVLQHPENKIVLHIRRPVLYLVAVYDIMPVSMSLISIPQRIFQEFLCFMNVPTIQFPKLYTPEELDHYTYTDLENQYGSIQNRSTTLGVMMTHLPTGQRCSIRNPVYTEIYKIRYLDTELQYQYLCLRHIGRVSEFLFYFPEHKGNFYRFYEQTRNFLENIHASYMSFYVLKEGIPISLKYWPYVRRLHKEVYLPGLGENPKNKITRSAVHQYMNKMSPDEWLYALNYEHRHLDEVY